MTASAAGPCTPAYAGLTRHGVSTTSGTCLYPRVRGADPFGIVIVLGLGPSTPACAGLTSTPQPTSCATSIYPRMRGADEMHTTGPFTDQPLPPRTRG